MICSPAAWPPRRVIVNATGPWVDELRALARVSDRGSRILRRTKGIHCLLPRLTDRAIYQSTRDNRCFVIPWREFSLVGTTDTDFLGGGGDLDRLHATRDEVDYLLGEVPAVPDPRVTAREVVYTYARRAAALVRRRRRKSDVSQQGAVVRGSGGRLLLSILAGTSRASAAWPRSWAIG